MTATFFYSVLFFEENSLFGLIPLQQDVSIEESDDSK